MVHTTPSHSQYLTFMTLSHPNMISGIPKTHGALIPPCFHTPTVAKSQWVLPPDGIFPQPSKTREVKNVYLCQGWPSPWTVLVSPNAMQGFRRKGSAGIISKSTLGFRRVAIWLPLWMHLHLPSTPKVVVASHGSALLFSSPFCFFVVSISPVSSFLMSSVCYFFLYSD
jgi:hypothetical protein